MTKLYSNQTVTSIDSKDMCCFPNCEFCQKLNDIGNVIFPKYVRAGESFDSFCKLFYHQVTERRNGP
jgi:hypothetical protein